MMISIWYIVNDDENGDIKAHLEKDMFEYRKYDFMLLVHSRVKACCDSSPRPLLFCVKASQHKTLCSCCISPDTPNVLSI